jgi:hypothetical protein
MLARILQFYSYMKGYSQSPFTLLSREFHGHQRSENLLISSAVAR